MLFVYPRNTKELRARYKEYVHEIELVEFGMNFGMKPKNMQLRLHCYLQNKIMN